MGNHNRVTKAAGQTHRHNQVRLVLFVSLFFLLLLLLLLANGRKGRRVSFVGCRDQLWLATATFAPGKIQSK
jgi:hypothetical protein